MPCVAAPLCRVLSDWLKYMEKNVQRSLNKAAKGTVIVFAGTVASIFLWFATKVLIIRNVTEEELGIYSLALAIATIFSMVSLVGLNQGVTRYVSISLGKGRPDQAERQIVSSLRMGTVFGAVSATAIFFLSPYIAKHVFYMEALTTPLMILSVVILFSVSSNILEGALRGFGDINPHVYIISIAHPVFFILFILLSLFIEAGLNGIVASYTLAIVVTWLCVAVYSFRKQRVVPLSLRSGGFGRELLRFSLPVFGVAIMGLVFAWTDTLMLGRYAGPADVGIYNIAISLVRLLTFVIGSAGFVFMPLVGELFSKGLNEEIRRVYQVLSKWVFSATLPIFFVLFFFPEMTITFLFEQRYAVSAESLRILSLGYMFYVFMGLNTLVITALGLQKELVKTSIAGIVLNIVLNYLLIKKMGMGIQGAAIATAVSYTVFSSMNTFILYRKTGIHMFTSAYIKPLLCMSAISAVIYMAVKSLPFTLLLMPAYFAIFIAAYVLSIMLTGSVEVEDVNLIEGIGSKFGLDVSFLIKIIKKISRI